MRSPSLSADCNATTAQKDIRLTNQADVVFRLGNVNVNVVFQRSASIISVLLVSSLQSWPVFYT